MVYNLGNCMGYSIRELIEVCCGITGHLIPERIGLWQDGDPALLMASSDKIFTELGCRPCFGKREAVS
jgi:UDP-glucose 4-epimerase